MINILLCDDDRVCLRVNQVYVEEFFLKRKIRINLFPFLKSGENLKKKIQETRIDIAVLDIDMESKESGIEMAKEVIKYNPYVAVIFVTSHPEFALEAYDITALGFLQKPMVPEKFEQLFKKVLIQLNGVSAVQNRSSFEIKSNRETHIIKESSVYTIEKCEQKLVITTKDGTYIVYEALKHIQERLSEEFIKINSGMLINRNNIQKISNKALVLKNRKEIPLTRKGYKAVYQVITKDTGTI